MIEGLLCKNLVSNKLTVKQQEASGSQFTGLGVRAEHSERVSDRGERKQGLGEHDRVMDDGDNDKRRRVEESGTSPTAIPVSLQQEAAQSPRIAPTPRPAHWLLGWPSNGEGGQARDRVLVGPARKLSFSAVSRRPGAPGPCSALLLLCCNLGCQDTVEVFSHRRCVGVRGLQKIEEMVTCRGQAGRGDRGLPEVAACSACSFSVFLTFWSQGGKGGW
ncbi:hypothetical protein B0J18DRAFT_134578 [Chaetomium sp. MPI-SDFR-AT-0129]|nr:hypothetical protein B0J18DRAFT_134578 [Chaetomium sp. MPI-SDFR-AT-0129]